MILGILEIQKIALNWEHIKFLRMLLRPTHHKSERSQMIFLFSVLFWVHGRRILALVLWSLSMYSFSPGSATSKNNYVEVKKLDQVVLAMISSEILPSSDWLFYYNLTHCTTTQECPCDRENMDIVKFLCISRVILFILSLLRQI